MLLDTLCKWKDARLRGFAQTQFLPEALSDTVYPNCDGSQLWFVLTYIDPDENAVFDELQVVGADRSSGLWRFYAMPHPALGFQREDRQDKGRWTRKEMVDHFHHDLLRNGYMTENCVLDCGFFANNNHFTEDQEATHRFFLKDTVAGVDPMR